MTWVMVPVPEELMQEVQILLYQLRGRANAPRWDDEAMGRHLLALEEEPRAVLSAVAAGVVAGDPVEATVLAERLGVSVRELFGLVMEANDVTVAPFAGALIFARRDKVAGGAEAAQGRRVLAMLPGYAHAIREQESLLGLRRAAVSRDH